MKLKKVLLVCLIPAFVISGCGKTTKDETENITKQEITAEESAQDEQETGNTEASGKDPNEKTEEASRDLFAMDTYMTLTAYGERAQEAVDKAAERVGALDALLSTGDENSEIYQLNQKGEATLSEDGGYLVERALSCMTRQKEPLILRFTR